jgi:hypothetical protein
MDAEVAKRVRGVIGPGIPLVITLYSDVNVTAPLLAGVQRVVGSYLSSR